jgi:hypothetical protein
MKVVLVTMIIFASLMSVATSVAFAQAVHAPATKAILAEAEVRRLNGEELDAFLHSNPRAMEQV